MVQEISIDGLGWEDDTAGRTLAVGPFHRSPELLDKRLNQEHAQCILAGELEIGGQADPGVADQELVLVIGERAESDADLAGEARRPIPGLGKRVFERIGDQFADDQPTGLDRLIVLQYNICIEVHIS